MARGRVYELRAPRDAVGREQQGRRYAVVVQSDDLYLSTCVVAPTSTRARPASFRPPIDIGGQPTRVLVEQVTTVDPQRRLGKLVGYLTATEMGAVDAALREVLSLPTRP